MSRRGCVSFPEGRQGGRGCYRATWNELELRAFKVKWRVITRNRVNSEGRLYPLSHLFLSPSTMESTCSQFERRMLCWQCFVTQLCPTLCHLMDYSLPGSSVHRILQVRVLEQLAIPFSRRSSQLRDQTQVSCITGRFFTV